MGIIGVVAALTLPNLNSSTGDKEKVAKLQKIYSNLNDAFGRAVAVYGPVVNWYTGENVDLNKKTGERLSDFLKVSKVCDGAVAGCFKSGVVYRLDNVSSGWNFNSSSSYKLLLADSISIYFQIYRPACGDFKATGNEDQSNVCGKIFVDIDGPNKGSYVWGKDIFEFVLSTDGFYPIGMQNEPNYGGDNLKNCFKYGFSCTGWVMESGNLDYLKADSTGKCKNSNNTLSWTLLSCK